MSPKLKAGHPARGQPKQQDAPNFEQQTEVFVGKRQRTRVQTESYFHRITDLKEFGEACSNWKIRELTAKWLVPTVCFGFVSSMGFIVLHGLKVIELSSTVITSLCISLPIEVIGIFGIVIRYLFPCKSETSFTKEEK